MTTGGGAGPTSPGRVLAVAASPAHEFSKQTRPVMRLIERLGVEETPTSAGPSSTGPGCGGTPPNLRQVHLVPSELLDELLTAGHRLTLG